MSQTAIAVLVAVAGVLLLVGGILFCFLAYLAYSKARRALNKLTESLAALSAFPVAAEKLSKTADVLAGVPRAVAAIAVEVQNLRVSIQAFSTLVLGGSKPNKSALSYPSEDEKELEFDINEFLSGDPSMSKEKAKDLAESARRGEPSALGVE